MSLGGGGGPISFLVSPNSAAGWLLPTGGPTSTGGSGGDCLASTGGGPT